MTGTSFTVSNCVCPTGIFSVLLGHASGAIRSSSGIIIAHFGLNENEVEDSVFFNDIISSKIKFINRYGCKL